MKEFYKELWRAFIDSQIAVMNVLYCAVAAMIFLNPELDAFIGPFTKWSLILLLLMVTLLEVMGGVGKSISEKLTECQSDLIKTQDEKIKILEGIIMEHERAQSIYKEMLNTQEVR